MSDTVLLMVRVPTDLDERIRRIAHRRHADRDVVLAELVRTGIQADEQSTPDDAPSGPSHEEASAGACDPAPAY